RLSEPGRRGAADRVRNAVEADRAADGVRAAAEAVRPEAVADERRPRCARFAVRLAEVPAARGDEAEQPEVAPGHGPRAQLLGGRSVAVGHGALREPGDPLELRLLGLEGLEVRD